MSINLFSGNGSMPKNQIQQTGFLVHGPIAENPDSTRHYLKDSLMFEPYLTLRTFPILDLSDPMDLSKAILLSSSAFADLLRLRDSKLVLRQEGPDMKNIPLKIVRVSSEPGQKDVSLTFVFWLVPITFNGQFWTYVLAADRDTLTVLEETFPPTDPLKDLGSPLDKLFSNQD